MTSFTQSSIDEEWSQFLLNNTNNMDCTILRKNIESSPKKQQQEVPYKHKKGDEQLPNTYETKDLPIPKCENLHISTKTKVLYLNHEIKIYDIFWNIPVLKYWEQEDGIIKKQIKIVSKTPEEYESVHKKLQETYFYKEHIIKQINNPDARGIRYKDERKITVGLSKKDILYSRIKPKNAFYNCFAIIYRFKYENEFREVHIKIFNTGKLEIPGVIDLDILEIVKTMILDLLRPHVGNDLCFTEINKKESVLINSNFNCGYFVNRDRLFLLLKSDKYGIEAAYDQCSYPGVKCKFYFNNDIGFVEDGRQNGQIIPDDRHMKMSELIENKKYTEVSFMIFRTGSCIIVGNCSEPILRYIYSYIRNILETEYANIAIKTEDPVIKNKNIRYRKKSITVTNEYFQSLMTQE